MKTPKSLADVGSSAGISHRFDLMRSQPDLGALVAEIIQMWSIIEWSLADTLSELLDGHRIAAVQMFYAVHSPNAQRLMLAKAANATLPADRAKLFDAVLDVLAQHRRVRNVLAHHVWVRNGHVKDALLLVRPDRLSLFNATVRASGSPMAIEQLKDDVKIYSKDVLESAFDDAKRMHDLVMPLHRVATHPLGEPLPVDVIDLYAADLEVSKRLSGLTPNATAET